MGHVWSLNEPLVTVPLVDAHLTVGYVTITESVSTKDVTSAIVADTLFSVGRVDPSAVLLEEGILLCEAPYPWREGRSGGEPLGATGRGVLADEGTGLPR